MDLTCILVSLFILGVRSYDELLQFLVFVCGVYLECPLGLTVVYLEMLWV